MYREVGRENFVRHMLCVKFKWPKGIKHLFAGNDKGYLYGGIYLYTRE